VKALLICEQYQFREAKFWNVAEIQSSAGIERLSANAFMFDLKTASTALARIQAFLSDGNLAYHVIYLTENYVHFKDPVSINTSLMNSAPVA